MLATISPGLSQQENEGMGKDRVCLNFNKHFLQQVITSELIKLGSKLGANSPFSLPPLAPRLAGTARAQGLLC